MITIKTKPAYIFAIIVIVIIAFYSSTVYGIFERWWQKGTGYSHGLLLFPISLYIFFKQIYKYKERLHFTGNIWFIFLLPVISFLWLLSYLIQVQVAEQLFFLLLLYFAIVAMIGWHDSRLFVFPFLLIIVSLPAWDVTTQSLQAITTTVVSWMLRIVGVIHLREGFLILLQSGTFEVARSCSGLNYQLAGISISLLFIYMVGMRFRHALPYIILTSIVVMFANIIRVFIVVMAGELTNMQSSLVHDHEVLGWTIFAVVMTIYIWVSGRVFVSQKTDTQKIVEVTHNISGRNLASLTVIILFAMSGPLLARVYSLDQYKKYEYEISLPKSIGSWQKIQLSQTSGWKPGYQKSNGTGHAYYRNARGEIVEIYLYQYLYQAQGREAINALNEPNTIKSWHEFGRTLKNIEGTKSNIQEIITNSALGHNIIWKWYFTNNEMLAGDYQTKLENLVARLKHDPQITVFLISPLTKENKTDQAALLEQFYRSAVSELGNVIKNTRY